MEGVVDRGTARTGADSRLHRRRQDRHGGQAGQRPLFDHRLQRSFVGFIPSRNPAARDHRRHRLAACGTEYRRSGVRSGVQAHRRGDAAVSRGWPDDQSVGAGARRGQERRGVDADCRVIRGGVSFVADEPSGTVPDLERSERAGGGPPARDARPERRGCRATASSSRRIQQQARPSNRTVSAVWCSNVNLSHHAGARDAAMTWAELQTALVGRGLAAGVVLPGGVDAAIAGVAYDSRAVTAGSGVRRAQGPARRRHRVRSTGHRARRRRDRLRTGCADRHPRALGRRQRRAARAGAFWRPPSIAIRAVRCGSSASPAPTARRRPRI